MSRTKKQFNVFNNINIVLSIVICGICVVNMIISIFIYILWIFVYTVGIQLIVIVGHRKMYELKMKNGWLIEEQKKVYIDTRLSASNGKTSVSMKYHWMLIVLTAVIYFFLFLNKPAIFHLKLIHFPVADYDNKLYSYDTSCSCETFRYVIQRYEYIFYSINCSSGYIVYI